MQRTTNNLGGDGNDKTSVKVAQAPGGNSSIQFGGDQQQQPVIKGKYHNQSSFTLGGEEQTKQQHTSVKVNQNPGGRSQVVFGDNEPTNYEKYDSREQKNQKGQKNQAQQAQQNQVVQPGQEQQQAVHTSVKVHNPPGGKSSITFG